MNQVTELLRLVPGASIDDAIIRLSTLFDLMAHSRGFQRAEILRKTDEPDLLLVLHAWDDIGDWTRFRSSETKMTFTSSRPAFLYTFVPCGIDWLLQEGETSQSGDFVQREVLRNALEPASGHDVIASQTFTYQDYEPSLEGAWLRLTRLARSPKAVTANEASSLDDGLFESIKKFTPDNERSKERAQVSR